MPNNLYKIIILCIFYTIVSVGFVGCKKQISRSNVSYVIGENNMEILLAGDPRYTKYKNAINSSVLVVTRADSGTTQYCSGVIIETDITSKSTY